MLTARDSVARALFNYNDITRFERGTMRRLAPFYSWSRKNIPYQVGKLLESPGYALAVSRAGQGIVTPEQRVEERHIPQFVKDSWGIQVSGDGKDAKFMLLGNYLPLADLVKLDSPESLKDYMINALTPFLKAPIELMMNWNAFFKDKIRKYPGEKVVFAGLQVSPEAAHVARNVRLLSEADAIIRWMAKTKGAEGGMYPFRRQIGLPPLYVHKGEQAKTSYILRMRDLRTQLMRDLRQAVGRKQMTRARQLVERIKQVDAALKAEGPPAPRTGMTPQELMAAAS